VTENCPCFTTLPSALALFVKWQWYLPAYVRFNGHFPGEPELIGSAQFSAST